MDLGWSGFAATLFVNALLTAWLAVGALRQRRVPGHLAFAGAMLSLAVWASGYAMETLAPALDAKIAWLRFENVGILLLLPFLLVFALEYAGWTSRSAWRLFPLLALVPSASLLLALAGSPLYYAGARAAPDAVGPLVLARGPWYHVQLAHSSVLMLAGTVMILRTVARLPSPVRAQSALLLAGISLPWAANLHYHARALWGDAGPVVDLTPLALGALGLVYGLGLFRLHLFEPRWLEPSAAPLRDRVERQAGRVVVARDVTERVQSERALAEMARLQQESSEQVRLLSAAISAAASAVALSDAKGICFWVNPAFTEITGYPPEEIVGRPLSLLKSGAHDEGFYRQMWQTILAGEVWRGEIVNRHRSGRLYVEEMTIAPVRDAAGALAHFVAVKQDVTERRRMEAELREANETLRAKIAEIEALQARLQEQATRDPLTGLYNRRFFSETLGRETARARREQQPYSLVILDADHFKAVNDTHGHEAGDQVLVALAQLLRGTREGDLVCRFGGEEFVVLLPGAGADAALARAEAWRAALARQPLLEDRPGLVVTVSGGVASFPVDGPDGASVLRAADQALYEAKAAGRNRVVRASGGAA